MKNNTPSELALLDTNILIYANQEQEEYHKVSKALRDRGQNGEISVCITPQVLSEFFAIVTRTGRGRASNPMSPTDASEEVKKYLESEEISKIYPTPETWTMMLSLIQQHPVTGQDIHDLHLAGTMLSNGVTKIYTFNARDFESIPGIEVLNPLDIEFEKAEEETEQQDPDLQ